MFKLFVCVLRLFCNVGSLVASFHSHESEFEEEEEAEEGERKEEERRGEKRGDEMR